MNAAFLLVTSAWFAGQTPAPPSVAAPVPASSSIASAPLGCGSGGCGSTGCDSCGSSCGYDACCSSGGFCSKLKGLLKGRGHGCSSCGSSCSTCDTCGTASYSGHGHHSFGGSSCCGTTSYSSCSTCDTGCSSGCGKHSRLKAFFAKHHNSGCCDTCSTGCDSCGSSGYVGGSLNGSIVPTPAPLPGASGEQLQTPPKKMPTKEAIPAPKVEQKQVRINNAPSIGTPIAPATPNLEVVPPSVPSLEAERRDPPF